MPLLDPIMTAIKRECKVILEASVNPDGPWCKGGHQYTVGFRDATDIVIVPEYEGIMWNNNLIISRYVALLFVALGIALGKVIPE